MHLCVGHLDSCATVSGGGAAGLLLGGPRSSLEQFDDVWQALCNIFRPSLCIPFLDGVPQEQEFPKTCKCALHRPLAQIRSSAGRIALSPRVLFVEQPKTGKEGQPANAHGEVQMVMVTYQPLDLGPLVDFVVAQV